METFLAEVLRSGLTAVLVFATLRFVTRRTVEHLFDAHRLKLEAAFERALKSHEAALELRSNQQLALFRRFVASSMEVVESFAKRASLFRQAVLHIDQTFDVARIKALYDDYCACFYGNPVVPEDVFRAAHEFRHAAEAVVGACRVIEVDSDLSEELVAALNSTYDTLLRVVRRTLLPVASQDGGPSLPS